MILESNWECVKGLLSQETKIYMLDVRKRMTNNTLGLPLLTA